MSNDSSDDNWFLQQMQGIKPLQQDKMHFQKAKPDERNSQQRQLDQEKRTNRQASFYFSDEFEPHIETDKALSYVRTDIAAYTAKQLRRGDFPPDITLDLHGLTQQQSKLELAALIDYCYKEHLPCACVVHGIGSKVLKQKVPHWLTQHPNVQAFHQAPLEWGGDGAILVLLEIEE